MTTNKSIAEGGVRSLSSVLKTLALLDVIGASPKPLKLAELTSAMKGNRATVYQRLVTLIEAGWVEVTDGGAYRLTLHPVRMAEAALLQANLGERATALLQQLVFDSGETVSLAMIKGNQVYIAKRIEAAGVLRAELHVGTVLSTDGSASGRVLTSYMSPAHLEHMQASGVPLPGEKVRKEVVARGYAVSSGKDVPEILAIAAPVFDRHGSCYAALSLVAPASRFKEDFLLPPLLKTASRLQELIAGVPES